MRDPVVAADGHTYDRAAIQHWLSAHHTSPLTGAALPHRHLTPNYALRSLISDLVPAVRAPLTMAEVPALEAAE